MLHNYVGCLKIVENAVLSIHQDTRRLGIEVICNLLSEAKTRIKLLDHGNLSDTLQY